VKSLHVSVRLRYNSIDRFADESSTVPVFDGTFGGMSRAKHKRVLKEGQFNAMYRGYVLYFIVNLQGIYSRPHGVNSVLGISKESHEIPAYGAQTAERLGQRIVCFRIGLRHIYQTVYGICNSGLVLLLEMR